MGVARRKGSLGAHYPLFAKVMIYIRERESRPKKTLKWPKEARVRPLLNNLRFTPLFNLCNI